MKVLNYKFLLILALLFVIISCQRGGGSRSSGSRSRSRSSSFGRSSYGRRRSRSYSGSSWSGWPFWNFSQTNETGNATLQGEQAQYQSSGTGYGWIGAILAAFGGFGYLGYKQDQKRKVERKQTLQKMFTQFEGKAEQNMCTLSQGKMNNLKDWFMSNSWRISFKTNDFSFRDQAEVTLTNIEQRSKFSYNFSMKMIDSIGGSKSEGILVHQADYFSIAFQKTYDNRTEAGQTGSFDLLVYEGVQQGQAFRGKWYYKGYQNNSQYSGTWEMTHL